MTEQTIGNMFEQAQKAIAADRLDEAKELLLHVVNAEPQNEQAWLLLADVVPEVAQSIACLERVLTINPDNEQAQAWLALALAAQSPGGGVQQDVDTGRPVPPLGRYLVSMGLVSAEQVDLALRMQADSARSGLRRALGEILVAQGSVTQAQVDAALTEQLHDVYALFVD